MTIGVFDGVHRGHQALIGRVVARAAAIGGQSLVLIVHPPPRQVLMRGSAVFELTSYQERVDLIAGLGVDIVARLEFTPEVSLLAPEAFLDLVQAHVTLREIWGGPDFAVGHKRAGTVARLSELGAQRGFTMHTLEPVTGAGGQVSSSKVRELIVAGDIEQATAMLGRYPRLQGEVVPGDRRGRTLGFPTANLRFDTPYLLPANGIYAVYTDIGGVRRPAVANIGVRPTFGDNDRLVEVYVLDYDGDLYGQCLSVFLVSRLRDEERFPSIEALIAQMRRDVIQAREVLEMPIAAPHS
jgi:riboflavin kinase / FMN adenylyltransferase